MNANSWFIESNIRKTEINNCNVFLSVFFCFVFRQFIMVYSLVLLCVFHLSFRKIGWRLFVFLMKTFHDYAMKTNTVTFCSFHNYKITVGVWWNDWIVSIFPFVVSSLNLWFPFHASRRIEYGFFVYVKRRHLFEKFKCFCEDEKINRKMWAIHYSNRIKVSLTTEIKTEITIK